MLTELREVDLLRSLIVVSPKEVIVIALVVALDEFFHTGEVSHVVRLADGEVVDADGWA
ncbi:hypothetical protein IMZ48_38485, partial [Candidatus Bathyarchaeota archaeon]|nr:hypothetical protein [Candidatus Bathyarchaeota archaeon]